ncbi:MAG: YeeE/YedE family protein [Moraxellaceae bacterium]|nr:YeeE/YedE family protein [Moraxellaceae bacterium]
MTSSFFQVLRVGVAVLVLVSLLVAGSALAELAGEGRILAFSLLAGTAFGIVLQRSRFCFYCMAADFFSHRDARGLLAVVVALAVGTIGYHAVFGAFQPVAVAGRFPPGAHIGPVSWVLALGAFVFGLGMAISGSCVSAHLYRLGEGAVASVLALLGAALGFVLGFLCWNTLYLRAIQEAPVLWLPAHMGYGGSLLLQLGLLGAIALWLLRYRTAPESNVSPLQAILVQRWPAAVGGSLVAFIAVLAYFRSGALGVTAELGSLARTAADAAQLLPPRLEGLDGFSGCATVVKQALLSKNAVFVLGVVGGAFAAALVAGQFQPRWPKGRVLVRQFAGGVLLGWGAMVALGCTIGTLLSGIMAGAVSGWVFAVFCLAGAWLGWRWRQRWPT